MLTIRALEEQRARVAFAAAVRAAEAAEQALARAEARLAESGRTLEASRARRFRGGEQSAFLLAFQACHEAVKRARAALDQANEARRRAQMAWMETRTRLRLIERMQQRARDAYRRECDRLEQAALDEFATARAHREAFVL
ncbi:flagellar FliJ family protein [Termitidicoccus mucosus]|uniref:flagellar FliJ family protein n=1 Tax=Termitidicoccus mucosus TaxID=1184151 RepID=UPI00318355E6